FQDNHDGPATLGGTPAAASGGVYSFTVTAHNGVGADGTQAFTLTVNQAPAITSAGKATFTVGAAGSFPVTSVGPPAPSLAESGALPGGVSFTDNGDGTAALAGTPATGSGGAYPLTITAANGLAPDAKQAFRLNVDQAAAISSAGSTTFIAGKAGSFLVTTT